MGDYAVLAEIFNALKTEDRIDTLRYIDEGYNLSETADELGMSYSTVHKYLSDHVDAFLVENEEQSYELTPLGDYMVNGVIPGMRKESYKRRKRLHYFRIREECEEFNMGKERLHESIEDYFDPEELERLSDEYESRE